MLKISGFIVIVFLFSCTKEKLEPLLLDRENNSPVSVMLFDNSGEYILLYTYDENGNIIRKDKGTEFTEYHYTSSALRLYLFDSYYGEFQYSNGRLSQYGQSQYLYDDSYMCTGIRTQHTDFTDTIRVVEQEDTIRMLANTEFFPVKYRTEFRMYNSHDYSRYVIGMSSLFYYSNVQRKYVRYPDFVPNEVCTIEYSSIKHYLSREVLEDIFKLRDYLTPGTGYLSMRISQILYLEESLPLLLPEKIRTPDYLYEFEYTIDDKNLLTGVQVRGKNNSGVIISQRTIKLKYSND